MTFEQIYEKYIGVFKVLMLAAGHETGNKSYLKIGELLDTDSEWRKNVRRAIEDEVEFRMFVGILISVVVIDVHGLEKLTEADAETAYSLIESVWEKYLKEPTQKFCRKYGIEQFDTLDISFRVMEKNKRID